jgi:hypothetical protein
MVLERNVTIMWTDRITDGEVFQRVKEEKLVFKILKIDAAHG